MPVEEHDELTAEPSNGHTGRLLIRMARTRVTDLLEIGWTGESSASFRTAFEQWEARGRHNVATLRRLVEGLRGALADMVSHEEAVTEETLSLSARLPVIDVAARLGEHR